MKKIIFLIVIFSFYSLPNSIILSILKNNRPLEFSDQLVVFSQKDTFDIFFAYADNNELTSQSVTSNGTQNRFSGNVIGINYRVFLDGININQTNPVNQRVRIINLSVHKEHLLTIEAHDNLNVLATSQSIRFKFQNSKMESEATPADSNDISGFLFVIIGLLLIALIVFVFLFFNKSKKSNFFESKIDSLQKNNVDFLSINKERDLLKKQNHALLNQLSELKKYNEVLEKANFELLQQKEKISESKAKIEILHEKKEELFATAIHDIKNPAAALKGYIELLHSYDLTAMEQQEILNSLQKISNKILNLTQEITQSITSPDGFGELNITTVNIKSVIDTVITRNLIAARKKEINLYSKYPDIIQTFKADPDKLDEIIDNLVSNAIKFSNSNSQIVIAVDFVNNNFKLDIIDQGIGLDPEDMRNLFKKGAKLSAKPTAGEKSSGLGLWIVKNLTEAHNGKVSARSIRGKGSTFTVEIPVVK